MFNIFKKKEPAIKVIDKVVISEPAKLKAMLSQWKDDNNIVFIFWFDESLQQAEIFFTGQTSEAVSLLSAREAVTTHLAGKTLVFAEHHPLRSKEEVLYGKMNLQTVQVYSSLKEPLLQRFGSDKIILLMQKLGMKEDEIIEHAMVSKSIRKAQENIEKKVVVDQTASSQAEWLQKNNTT